MTTKSRTKTPAKQSKYKNVKAEYEGEIFDSKFELEVYKQLVRLFTKQRIARQVKIQLRKTTSNFRSTDIILDFGIIKQDDPLDYEFFVEAKGYLTPECLLKLRWLESILPHSFEICHFIVNTESNNLPKSCKQVLLNQLEECQQDGIRNLFQTRNR